VDFIDQILFTAMGHIVMKRAIQKKN